MKYKSKKINKKKKTNNKNNNFTRSKKGGEVIGAGGYGCIFSPALRCADSNERKGDITKLLEKNDANDEWNELKNVRNIVKNIPNYNNYFLVSNIFKCKPNKITENDLKNVTICENALGSIGISTTEINKNLDKLEIINMPYGGVDLLKIITENKELFSALNNILLELLVKAILPMNKLGFFHCDIKAQNILYLKDKCRLIDWGISTLINNIPVKVIPEKIKNNKLQYNSPFSRIIFNKIFDDYYKLHIKNNSKINKSNSNLNTILQVLMFDYYFYFTKLAGDGHENFINSYFIPEFFKINGINNVPKDFNLTAYLFSLYMTKILIKYIDFKDNTFKKTDYFNEVYIKNLDIWGFISIYFEYIMNNYNKTLKINLSNIIIDYCYSDEYAEKPIDISKLVVSLKNANKKSAEKINLNKLFKIAK